MSEQPAIHKVRFARQVSAEAIADSGSELIDELVAELVGTARDEFNLTGLTLIDLKISFGRYEPTADEMMRRESAALAGQYALILVARGVPHDQALASGGSL